MIQPVSIDHLVLVVRDVERSADFYVGVLGMRRVDHADRIDLHFGEAKLTLCPLPAVPRPTPAVLAPGSADLCLQVAGDARSLARELGAAGVVPVAGPAERVGAVGPVVSTYVADPDGNLVELAVHPRDPTG